MFSENLFHIWGLNYDITDKLDQDSQARTIVSNAQVIASGYQSRKK